MTTEIAAPAEPRLRVRTGRIDGQLRGTISLLLPDDWSERCRVADSEVFRLAGGDPRLPDAPQGEERVALIARMTADQDSAFADLAEVILARLPAIRSRREMIKTLTGDGTDSTSAGAATSGGGGAGGTASG
jgi:hypothetical protein